MINTTCSICSSLAAQSSSIYNFQKDNVNFHIKACENCNHIYTYYTQEIALQEYYDELDYKVRDTQKTIFYRIQEIEYKSIIHILKRLSKKHSPSVIDFGAGKGVFLNFAKEEGLIAKGVETSKPRADYAKQFFDLKINTDEYTSGRIFETKVDIITLYHVLEHINKPIELLSNLITHNLNDNGILFVEVPNFKSWQSKWAGANWLHLDVPRHINHFHPKDLTAILQNLGFDIKATEYFSIHMGIIGMTQSIWNIFGYKGFLISDLKSKKSFSLMLKLLCTLPFAFLLETIACLFNKGGIIRLYAQKNINEHSTS